MCWMSVGNRSFEGKTCDYCFDYGDESRRVMNEKRGHCVCKVSFVTQEAFRRRR